jgi:hypothetical protein
MGEVLGIGLSHYPPLLSTPDTYANILRWVLDSPLVPPEAKRPESWPAPMQDAYAHEQKLAREHQEALVESFRALRQTIDAFGPDAIVIFGDDQYENFREDCIPPFCVYLYDQMESQPFVDNPFVPGENAWGEPGEQLFRHRGHKALAMCLATELSERGFPVAYAYRNSHYAERHGPNSLTHAFLNALVFLDWDRKGFDYPVVPIQVNSYGKDIVRTRGGIAHLFPTAEPRPFGEDVGPAAPSAAACYRLGELVRGILDETPGRYIVMASSSWSHAFLTAKHHWLYPDLAADESHVDDLRAGRHTQWARLANAAIDDAGQHEFRNWICLAGATGDRRAEVLSYVPTYIFNSNKCFAIFRPDAAARGQ